MAHSTRASSSSDGPDLEHCDQLEPQRRESSVENFDPRSESPTITQFLVAHLHEKLFQVGHLPSKQKTQDELYYMAKTADSSHWPWERADILTPTPPEERTDMLTPTPPSSLETSSPKIFVQAEPSPPNRTTFASSPKAQFAQQTVEYEKSKWRDAEEADSPKEALDAHKIKKWRAMLMETKRLLRWWMKVHKYGIYLRVISRELKPANPALGSCAKGHKSTTIQNVLAGLRRYQGTLPKEVLNQ
ncbi:uncharacterized protein LY89DRAFT_784166 [Mollisia scopiformis]|uniref:Uncharacterized protein n=1 Tax=Mollisia scopiformis TaxID=149040 RepID=A0A194X2D9_MOLSC|nr:uncharacterized protein LY89DRAFT_784166 [Mollisia scopiformis]KUJ14174.1 hypothetical protein LY89DRAFT_784166 [Mollisia scopiformis]